MKTRPECCFTKSGILSLQECPCATCLIKTVCSDVCDGLIEMIQKDRHFHCYEPHIHQYIEAIIKI